MPAKPKKRHLRPRNIILGTLALLAALVGYQVYAALTAKPGTAIDYPQMLEDHVVANQPVPTGEDAWPIFLDAIARTNAAEELVWPAAVRNSAAVPPLDYSIVISDRSTPTSHGDRSWDEAEAPALRALQALRDGGVFDRLADVARAPRAVRPVPRGGWLIGMLLPELGKARNLARAQAARMYLARQRGDDQEFIAAFEQALALGRITAQQPVLIDHLVGIAIVSLALNHLGDALTERPFGPETCRELLAAMDRQLPLTPLSYAIESERIWALDTIQWTHTDDGRGSGRLIPSALAPMGGLMGGATVGSTGSGWLDTLAQYRIINLASLAYPSKAKTVGAANSIYDSYAAYSKLSYAERRRAAVHPDTLAAQLPRRQVVLRMLLPAIGKALQSQDSHAAQVAGARTFLALEIYHAQHGRYPDTLDQLVPAILPALPLDPHTGRPLCYRLLGTNETPAEPPPPKLSEDEIPPPPQPPRAFLLYTTGADTTDNGGQPAGVDGEAFNPGRGVGTDYIINVRRNRPAINPPPPPPKPAGDPAE